jgi:Altered inheritance of mitochondria protein 21
VKLISLGTNDGLMSYPDEQIGYLASDRYSSRIASPAQGGGYLQKLHSNNSQPLIESQLRPTSFSTEVFQKSEFAESQGSISGRSEVIDSEVEEDVIHVDHPDRRYNKVTGGEETIHETEDLGPNQGKTPDLGGYISENGYGVPILASDEVAKDIGSEHMQPAVSPKQERRGSAYLVTDEFASGNITPTSRPSSRPVSIHGFNASLSRFMSRHEDREDIHTPLEDVDEYEPLFPDEDENHKGTVSAAERFKLRPGALKHRFPSQDIWEDTPSSAMHVATVSTPDVPPTNDSVGVSSASKVFEDPSVESARKGEVTEADKAKLIPKDERLATSQFAPHLRDDMPARPDMQQRFPSRDIWEDTPDSMHLVTTVASPPPPGEVPMSPEDGTPNKPSIPQRPLNRSRLGESSTKPSVLVSAEVKQPQVPARPSKRDFTAADANQSSEKNSSPTEGKKGPSLPDRPKPQVPVRPAKKESLEALTKTLSGASSGSQDTVISQTLSKAKPAIPARPVASKPNLPAAFMSDLNQRLQLGPRPPIKEKEPEPEPEAEKEALPLSDARKGRARGPQRRAPAKSPSAPAETASSSMPKFSIASAKSLWSISQDDGLTVHSLETSSASSQSPDPKLAAEDVDSKATTTASTRPPDAPKPMAPPGLALNTAGESADPSPMESGIATPGTEKSDPLSKSVGSLARDSKEASSSVSKQATTSAAAPGGAQLGGIEAEDEESDKPGITESRDTTDGGSMASGEQQPQEVSSSQEPRTASDESVSKGVLAADAGAEPTSSESLEGDELE